MFDLVKFFGFLSKRNGFQQCTLNSEGEAKQIANMSGRALIGVFVPVPSRPFVPVYLYAERNKKKEVVDAFLKELETFLGSSVSVEKL